MLVILVSIFGVYWREPIWQQQPQRRILVLLQNPPLQVKVSDFLRMTGPPEPHNVLQEKGLLHQWYPGMFVSFISHQWLSSVHPDPEGRQVEVLQKALLAIIEGSLQVHEDITSRTEDKCLSPQVRQQLAEGFLFFDWFAIPQLTARKAGVNEDTTRQDAALAVQSIPAYVELSTMFIALVPELVHSDSSQPVNYATWLSRGWCRAELWCRLLSNRADTSVVVVYTAVEAEFMFPLDWQHSSIVEGDFTVEADRAEVVRLGEMAVESKIQHLQSNGPLSHYRFYAALRPQLLRQLQKDRDMDDFLQHFRFESLAVAVQDKSSMNAVMCAVLSGDISILRRLAEKRADMNTPLHGMGDLGYYDTQTALIVATKSQQAPSLLEALVQLRADVNGRSRTGLPALFFCRSPQHVKVLAENGARIDNFVLGGAATFAGPDTVEALLAYRCEPTASLYMKSSPLHAAAMGGRSNARAVEIAKLLLAHRANATGLMLRNLIGDAIIRICTKWQGFSIVVIHVN